MILGNKALRRSSPEAQGIPSRAIINFLNALSAAGTELHGFQLIRNDCLVAEGTARPLTSTRFHRIYSAAKGIVAIGVLLALQNGVLTLDEKLVDIFSDNLPENVDEKMKRVTVYHLLTMNSGHDIDTCVAMFRSDNWVKCFIGIPPRYEPGTHFCYNNGIPHVLAEIVKRKTGQDVFVYMKDILNALGIEIQCRYNGQGEREPSTVATTLEALTKIGYLFLKEGVWNGERLLDAELCRMFGAYHVPSAREIHPYGYGFQVWRLPCDGYCFDGGRENYSMVYVGANMVFATIACNMDSEKLKISDAFHEMVYQRSYAYPIAEDSEAQQELQQMLGTWNLAPKGSDRSSAAQQIDGKTYTLRPNSLGCTSIAFRFSDDERAVTISTVQGDGAHHLHCGFGGEWHKTSDYVLIGVNLSHGNFIDGEDASVQLASGAWTDAHTLTVYGRSFARIESDVFQFHFRGDALTISVQTPPLALPGLPEDSQSGKYELKGISASSERGVE